ncbi:twin-arginine translocase subunit TatC [Parenemella sanctibonifatiensis]|nr:twin-arginine translocase subunit TatC [Parenemella sanctibonifatiensis]
MALKVAKPRLSLGWLKPPVVPPDGNMSLWEHIAELRYRLVMSVLGFIVTTVIAAFFYRQLVAIILYPWDVAIADLAAQNPDVETALVNQGVAAPFMLAVKATALAGLIAASPIWLYQLWKFIAPGLLANERKWSAAFMLSSIPLFLMGVAIGYLVLPKGISFMLGFTPDSQGITNMLEINQFLDLVIRLMLVFGLAFLMPVVVCAINFMGVVSAAQLANARNGVVFGTFVFGAVATPSGDPLSMLALAVPMSLLYVIAEIICRVHDRRKAVKPRFDPEV